MIPTLLLAALLALPGPTNAAYNGCSAWHSESIPPRTIRVRLDYHTVVRVNFMRYVAVVVSSEFNSVPLELRKAGAVAVKVYGWYRTLRPRPSKAGCFDVNDSTADQIYRHHKMPPEHVWSAVRATWGWRVLREGRLISTGYRTGRAVGCARDIDGWHLFARSAARCARLGWTARHILERYYEGRVTT